jgi:hypothetical protein
MKAISYLILLLFLVASCDSVEQTSNSQIDQKATKKTREIPEDGHAMIDLLISKAQARASLNEEEVEAVRGIFEEVFIEKYGDLNMKIEPDNYLEIRKAVFFGSSARVKKYMKDDKKIEKRSEQ